LKDNFKHQLEYSYLKLTNLLKSNNNNSRRQSNQ